MLDVNIFRSQPKRGVYGSVKAGQKSVYPLGVGVNIFCDLARNVFTIKQMKGKYKRIIKNSRKTTKLRQKSEPTQGEAKVIKFLMENNIEFIREFFHRTLYNPVTNRLLYLDFYLPTYKVAIEFDGVQHYKPVYGHVQLAKARELDQLKNIWCWQRGIRMLRIKYNEDVETEICKFFDRLGI